MAGAALSCELGAAAMWEVGAGPALRTARPPASLDFGSVAVGQQPARTMPVTIRNSGGGTLTVSSLSIPDNPQFSLVQPPGTPFDVPAAGGTPPVPFTPTAAIARAVQRGTLTT